jgi:hypothetical protein
MRDVIDSDISAQVRRLVTATCLLAGCLLSNDVHAQTRCGTERWPVKTLADLDSGKVAFAPVPSTIADLTAIPIPEIPYPIDRRIAPHELRVYRVRAVVSQIISEDDGDWHVVLRDPSSSASMIAEIPSPECAATPHCRRAMPCVVFHATAKS